MSNLPTDQPATSIPMDQGGIAASDQNAGAVDTQTPQGSQQIDAQLPAVPQEALADVDAALADLTQETASLSGAQRDTNQSPAVDSESGVMQAQTGALPDTNLHAPPPPPASPQQVTLPAPPPPPAVMPDTTSEEQTATVPESRPVRSVVDVLTNKGAISVEQVEALQAESLNTGADLLELLEQRQMVSEEQLARAKAEYYNIAFVDLSEVGVAPEAMSTLNESIAQRYLVLPFAIDRASGSLSVAMANPLDLRAIDFVEKKTGMRVQPYLATASNLSFAISERYAQSLSSEVTEALRDTSVKEERKVVDVHQLGEVIREAPIAKIVETVLTFAIKSRASDVHIEAQETKTRVRYRIDGILHEKLVLPKGVHDALISRIKILADLKIDEKRLPQDGRFSFTMGEQEVDLRVSTLPTVNGEKVVMRLLQKAQKVPTLGDLGLRGLALKKLEDAILVPHGIVLVTGPTGSGKTTTLYSILNKINTPKVNIVTLEDPVEYEIPGVNQVQINPKAGLTFASGLRSFLRQDPNIIQVGEIRDQETTELAIQASLTGHLVFSTLHTNSASGALPRLLDMKAEPFLLASSITAIVGQRVVRKICEYCRTEYKPEQAVVEDMKMVLGEKLFAAYLVQKQITVDQVMFAKGEGCSECGDTGYQGRVGIYEVLSISETISTLLLERAPAHEIEKAAINEGMLLMKQDGYLKVLEHITTIEEVLRVAQI